MLTKNCKNCASQFEIADDDLAFYEKISPVFGGEKYIIPPPQFCPVCREQRRWAFRNQSKLYKRTCDFTGEPMISLYSPDKPYKVYKEEIWWSDKWDPLSYGRDFDFSRPFFEQFSELLHAVPRRGMHQDGTNENSDYTNYAYKNKNCYLVFGGHYNEDTFYGQYTWRDTDCVDCDKVGESELCYECTFGSNLYDCDYLYNCFSCSDCEFGYDLVNCRNCFLCAGLRNSEYFIKNKQVSKDEYKNAVKKLKAEKSAEKLLDELADLRHTIPQVNLLQKNCEDCMGTFLENSKNCFYTFNATNAEDCLYIATNNDTIKDSMDCDCIGYDPSELLYECIGNSGNNNCNFCYACWHNSDLEYCEQVFNSKHCFGCISRSHAEFEILNKKYSKEEWFKRVAEIKAELAREKVYGKWLLPSSYPYEDTIAPLYFS